MLELIRRPVNQAMLLPFDQHLGAGAYQRSASRRGYVNDFKDKTIQTRMGQITCAAPQGSEGGFYPQAQ